MLCCAVCGAFVASCSRGVCYVVFMWWCVRCVRVVVCCVVFTWCVLSCSRGGVLRRVHVACVLRRVHVACVLRRVHVVFVTSPFRLLSRGRSSPFSAAA